MKCITIEHEVDAYEVEWLLKQSKEDWGKLPKWFKKMHQENRILIGGSVIQVETEEFNITSRSDDVLFYKNNGYVDVLPKVKFYKLYRDAFCG